MSLKALTYFADGDLNRLPVDAREALAGAAASVTAIDVVPVLSPRLT